MLNPLDDGSCYLWKSAATPAALKWAGIKAVGDNSYPKSLPTVASHHTQRRRRERVSKTNSVGAKTAIQSQCTYLPNSGLTTALRIMAPATKAPAHPKATGQLRPAFSSFAPRDFVLTFAPATALLLLARLFIVTYQPFP